MAYLAPGERLLLSRFWQSASGFWRGKTGWRGWFLVMLLVATVFLQLVTQYRLNFWNRDFFNALARKDSSELWVQALKLLPIALGSLSLAIISVWGRMTLQRKWREYLSGHLYDDWLGGGHDARLQFMAADHQTPEYRIAEDARVATDLPVDLLLGLFSSCITAGTFIGVLWSVGGSFDLDAFGNVVVIPGYLVQSVVAYSILLTGAMMYIARHLTHLMEENKRTEAELRSIGTHLRESVEGGSRDADGRRSVAAALKAVLDIWRDYCWQLMRMTVITHTNTLLTPFIAMWCRLPRRSSSFRVRSTG